MYKEKNITIIYVKTITAQKDDEWIYKKSL